MRFLTNSLTWVKYDPVRQLCFYNRTMERASWTLRARGLAGRRLLCTEEIVGSNPTGSTSAAPGAGGRASIHRDPLSMRA